MIDRIVRLMSEEQQEDLTEKINMMESMGCTFYETFSVKTAHGQWFIELYEHTINVWLEANGVISNKTHLAFN